MISVTAIVFQRAYKLCCEDNQLTKTAKKRTNEGAVIRRLRMEAGISQEHLARRVGLTTHTIWRLENDPGANPRLETLRAIARALGVRLSEVIGD